jgi:sugar/nucleoside kinase (ribokinase family)
VGPLNLDLFVRGSAPTDPVALAAWVGPSEVELLVAGSIGYPAQALARLGATVELHSHVGDDGFGAHIRSTLVGAGIADRFLETVPGESAIAIYLLLFGGQKRPMTYRLPGSAPWPAQPAFIRSGERVPDLVHSGGLLHFPGMWHSGLAASLRQAREAGVTTSVDPQFPLDECPAPWAPHLADVLEVSDILLCDEHELQMLFAGSSIEEDLQAAHSAGPDIVVVKRGAAGSVVSGEGLVIDQPAVAVPSQDIREAVGAGDAYDAGFLDSVVRGGTLVAAAAFATATAALTLTARGGAEGIVDRDAVLAVLPRVPEALVRT